MNESEIISPLEKRKTSVLLLVSRWLRNVFNRQQDASLKEAIEEVLHVHEEQTEGLAAEEKVMLRNMLSFGELTAGDIMTPQTEIAAVASTVTLEALKEHIAEQRHTRIPVYEESLDHVKGFLHVKDLVPMLGKDTAYDLAKLLRQVLFVPPSMRIVDILLKMRLSGVHMAIVVDEYGGTQGLVTLEDLFEEIVGEIQDEHDEAEDYEKLHWVSDRVVNVDGRMPIEILSKELSIDFTPETEDAGFTSLGGLIFYQLGRVPGRGEVIDHASGIKFEILEADPRRISRVRIRLIAPAVKIDAAPAA